MCYRYNMCNKRTVPLLHAPLFYALPDKTTSSAP